MFNHKKALKYADFQPAFKKIHRLFSFDRIIYLAIQYAVNNFYSMKTIAVISPDADEKILIRLKKQDIEPVLIDKCGYISKPIAGHPDMQIFKFGNILFCHPDISLTFLKKIEKYAEIKICNTKLSPRHPYDIPYNILYLGNSAIHKLKYTEPEIKKHLENVSVQLIDVKQGYTKCSCIPAGNSVITADDSIYRTCSSVQINSLKITPGFINLPGYKYGFIGGASGVSGNRIYLTGNLNNHPDKKSIENFAESINFSIFYLTDNDPIDLGTIFFI